MVFVGIIFIHLIIFFLFTPFFKPFRLSRIIFTYALPLIPLCTIWDGMVSIIRLHEPKNLQKIVQGVDPNKRYFWKIGKAKHRFGLKVSYLIGYSNDYKTDV